MTSDLKTQIARRRTFAIISHPDAGKTTLTEKLLLYGGAIQTAGQVAARRRARAVTSDWMALERERGISITSTVLQFPYHDYVLNLLDTPGHQDFGEDTYRTLLAADAALMLIDAAKGVEPQTRKLFAICRARGIPLFTFMNKMDRPSRDPLELLDELESILGIGAYAINWPLGNGPTFRGVYDRSSRQVHVFERTEHGAKQAPVQMSGLEDERLRSLVDDATYRQFRDEIDLLEGAGESFDSAATLRGEKTPVFFGSAVTNFGVQLFLDAFIEMAPPPAPREGKRLEDDARMKIEPLAEHFTGFVFKIQANMDPRHRDRVAFVRITSGRFERDMVVKNARSGKDVRLTRAMRLFAADREVVDEAFAGDVVGLANPGTFAIGDTLCEGETIALDPIPSFAPEYFALVRSPDSASYKAFQKGLEQLREEGAVQVFYTTERARAEPILAAVGELQFEVTKYRLEAEYGVRTEWSRLPFTFARKVAGSRDAVAQAQLPSAARLVNDALDAPVLLFENDWSLRLAEEWNPALRFVSFEEAVELRGEVA